MPNIEQMIEDILRREGGFVDHPADRGGPTKYGITQKTLSTYLGLAALRKDVESLREEVARKIYWRNYYIAPKIDQLPPSVQPFVFDCAVNHGPQRAIKFVQNVCNQAGYQPPLSVDGAMGPKTQRGAEWAEEQMGETFLKFLLEERRDFYRLIVQANPSQQVFFNGWMNRVEEFEQEIV